MTTTAAAALAARVSERIEAASVRPPIAGKVVRVTGLTIEAVGCSLPVGARCTIELEGRQVMAEVVGFAGSVTHLMPLADSARVYPGAPIVPGGGTRLAVGESLLGRVVDGLGRALDHGPPLPVTEAHPTWQEINPLERAPIDRPLDVGVRAINGLFGLGVGQRVGLFAGSGVGKSVLLGMLARFTRADVVVVGLIGERGREVREFIEDDLGAALERSVVVAAPADTSPVARIQGAIQAIDIAEHFRARGDDVVLLIDSLTRIAQARREIGLAMGEPPATKGYPPSAFAILPRLLERSGRLSGEAGSITGFYTVLMEEDDLQDPIVDTARAVLDGHLVLTRSLADTGHYPAIDVESSISRLQGRLVAETDLAHVRRFRELWSRYERQRDLISVGAYVGGTDPLTDEAIRLRPAMLEFLRQPSTQAVDLPTSRAQLMALFGTATPHAPPVAV